MFEVLSREIAFLKSAFAVLWLGKPEGEANSDAEDRFKA